MKTFNYGINTKGRFMCSYVFSDEQEIEVFKKTTLVELERTYGKLKLDLYLLPGLKIGDYCNVNGEGTDEFKIECIRKLEDFRYSFGLDNGCWESVHKCHRNFLDE